jgi:YVTN family beta-propeller protein
MKPLQHSRTSLLSSVLSAVAVLATGAVGACDGSSGSAASGAAVTRDDAPPSHSSSIALAPDGHRLFVVNPDNDSVSVIDVQHRRLERELLLAAARPAADPVTGAYTPAVMPRAVAVSRDSSTLYVTGERSSALHVVDVASGQVRAIVHVGSEPIGVVLSPDGASAFVACSQDDSVVKVDTATSTVVGAVAVPTEPWALAWTADGSRLLVTHFMGAGVTSVAPKTMSLDATWRTPDVAPRGDKRLAHGAPRGFYDLAARPGTTDIWTVHALLATDTAQPELDFRSTVFPSLSILSADGAYRKTLSTDAQDVPGVDGAIADVVSGPHALAFTRDGRYALMVDANSEDVLVLDARAEVEAALVRPLPGKMPEGIVLSSDEQLAYVDERVSGDVAVLRLDRSSGVLKATADGAPILKFEIDPMPATLRLGQHLFNSANSTEYPITTDHWVACATCHMEGRSDAVTWRFFPGPRDTPTNAGGMLGTGHLFRTADRARVQDYWHTINIEQGGSFDPLDQAPLLDAIAAYVNLGIPLPIPPTTDPALVARGAKVFHDSGCASCHSGPRFTDSGTGNPTLDLAGPLVLHDVGTCDTTGPFPDVAHEDDEHHPRGACAFDTPSLNGVASTPPYLHDGSAPTIRDAVLRMPNPPPSPSDLAALVEYLRSL